jgi:hypothetical protein
LSAAALASWWVIIAGGVAALLWIDVDVLLGDRTPLFALVAGAAAVIVIGAASAGIGAGVAALLGVLCVGGRGRRAALRRASAAGPSDDSIAFVVKGAAVRRIESAYWAAVRSSHVGGSAGLTEAWPEVGRIVRLAADAIAAGSPPAACLETPGEAVDGLLGLGSRQRRWSIGLYVFLVICVAVTVLPEAGALVDEPMVASLVGFVLTGFGLMLLAGPRLLRAMAGVTLDPGGAWPAGVLLRGGRVAWRDCSAVIEPIDGPLFGVTLVPRSASTRAAERKPLQCLMSAGGVAYALDRIAEARRDAGECGDEVGECLDEHER